MRVKDVMTTDGVSVLPGASLKDVAQLLVDHGITGLPVVDSDGRVIGVVSETDLLVKERGAPARRGGPLAWLVDPLDVEQRLKLEARVAGEAMTAPAVTISPSRSLAVAAEVMLDSRVNRLPVVSSGDELVGIVTRADLVRAFIRPDADLAREIREEVLGQQMLLDEHAVDVEIEAGEVVLTGGLRRKSQADLLPRLVGKVAGVVRVDDSKLAWYEDDTRR